MVQKETKYRKNGWGECWKGEVDSLPLLVKDAGLFRTDNRHRQVCRKEVKVGLSFKLVENGSLNTLSKRISSKCNRDTLQW